MTTALGLSARGYAVTLIEQRERLGGRLAPTESGAPGAALPPVCFGWQQHTQSLLGRLGTLDQIDWAGATGLEFILPGSRTARLLRVPAPWTLHGVLSLFLFRGLSWPDRWRLLMWLERTWEGDPPLPADLDMRTAETWLSQAGQSDKARATIWDPLCRLLLGEGPSVVSAAMLIGALRPWLDGPRATRIGVPAAGLPVLLLDPLLQRLAVSGVVVRLNTSAAFLRFDAHHVTALQLQSGEELIADWYVSALPHPSLGPLLPERAVTRFSYFQQLGRLIDVPAVAVELRFDATPPSPRAHLLSGTRFHAALTMCDTDDPRVTRVSLLSSGSPESLARSDQELIEEAVRLHASFGARIVTGKLLGARVIREERALLSVRPGTAALRPLQQSPFPNLFLVGDWTDTGLPSGMESAIVSANLCVEAIAAKG